MCIRDRKKSEKLKRDIWRKKNDLKRTITEQKERIVSLEEIVSKTRENERSFRETLKDYKAKLATLEERIRASQREQALEQTNINQSMREKDDIINNLRNQLSLKDNELELMNQSLIEAETQSKILLREKKAIEEKALLNISELEKVIRQKGAEVGELTDKNEKLKELNKAHLQSLLNISDKTVKLEKSLELATKEIEMKQDLVMSQTREHQDLDGRLQEALEKTKTQRNEIARLKSILFLPSDYHGTQQYDLTIGLPSLMSLNTEGWSIKRNLDKFPSKLTFIAISGGPRCGKSFVLKLLSGRDISYGPSFPTQGINFLLRQTESMEPKDCFLDTPGWDSPFQVSTETDHSSRTNDSSSLEAFIHSYAVEIANTIVYVVGKVSAVDQQRIINFQKLFPKKQLIVIHNFSWEISSEGVQTLIQREIVEIFGAKDFQGRYVSQRNWKEHSSVIHLIFARENSEAGHKYNAASISIFNKLCIADARVNSEDIMESFIQFSNRQLEQMSEDEKPVQLEVHNDRRIKVSDLHPFKCGKAHFDAWDLMVRKQVDQFVPKHAVYYGANEDIKCYIDLPNMDDYKPPKIDLTDGTLYLNLKAKMRVAESIGEVYINTRFNGQVDVRIPLGRQHLHLLSSRPSKKDCEFKDGILFIHLKKEDQEENQMISLTIPSCNSH
eukprot:TRINITY_DN1676_c0_g1_i4.p1 TRINITY_DN1676_c0_g1~~TRINITY_DN1676_c0_g1_i4.p1  ORF type:complete len:686 (+),score=74.23 TRINITY_DN1676_c0_g1_i4:47-2059(+)